MALTFPALGSTRWDTTYEPILQNHEDRLIGLEAGGGGAAGWGGASAGQMHLDLSFPSLGAPGLAADAKFSAFRTAAQAELYPSSLTWDNLRYDFSVGNVVPYDNMRMVGPPGIGNAERLGQTKMASRFHLSMTGPWIKLSGSTADFDGHFENLALTGGGTQAVFLGMQSGATASWRNLIVRNITYVNLRGLLGEYATKLLVTSPTLDGWWEGNACYDTHIHIGGSGEGVIWPQGGIFDGGQNDAYTIAGGSTGHPLFWLDGYDFANVGPGVFITAEGTWEGLRVNGPGYNTSTGNQGGPIRFWGLTVEGRNTSQPCKGSLIRCIGGICEFYGLAMAHCLSDPTAPGHSPTDAGALDLQSGAYVDVTGFSFDRHTVGGTQAETTPAIKVRSGTTLRPTKGKVGAKGGTWSDPRPRITVDATGTCLATDGTWILQ